MAVMRSLTSDAADPKSRPLLGVRRHPGRLALAVFRLPLPLYRGGWGWLLGRTFLLVVHEGRKTGKLHSTVAMALTYDPKTREAVVCSVWGETTDWIRNIRARPAVQVQIGRESFTPEQRFLSDEESLAVAVEFRHRHPWRLRLFTWILGWDDLDADTAVREFVRSRPFVSFRPAALPISSVPISADPAVPSRTFPKPERGFRSQLDLLDTFKTIQPSRVVLNEPLPSPCRALSRACPAAP
jgi:deazaflavin-dependent oxidoreductase (nitroreductase family)